MLRDNIMEMSKHATSRPGSQAMVQDVAAMDMRVHSKTRRHKAPRTRTHAHPHIHFTKESPPSRPTQGPHHQISVPRMAHKASAPAQHAGRGATKRGRAKAVQLWRAAQTQMLRRDRQAQSMIGNRGQGQPNRVPAGQVGQEANKPEEKPPGRAPARPNRGAGARASRSAEEAHRQGGQQTRAGGLQGLRKRERAPAICGRARAL